MLAVNPLSNTIGADIYDLDARSIISGNQDLVSSLEELISRHKVLRFRKQSLTPTDLIAIAKRFGPVRALRRPDKTDVAHIADHPEIKVVSNVKKDGTFLGDGDSSELSWHTDGSYLDTPTALTFLYGVETPEHLPPKTYFMDLSSVYKALPEVLKQHLSSMRAVHYSHFSYAPEYAAEIKALVPGADRRHIGPRHPLVRTDEKTGEKSLFPPRQRDCLFEGLSIEESEKLSNVLWSLIERYPEFWGDVITRGDLLIFDNNFSMHRRESFDAKEERILWHVTTDSPRPN